MEARVAGAHYLDATEGAIQSNGVSSRCPNIEANDSVIFQSVIEQSEIGQSLIGQFISSVSTHSQASVCGRRAGEVERRAERSV